MAKQLNKPAPPKRRRTGKSATYWVVFVVFALASFAGGFWFTYRGTQVSIKEPPVGPAPTAIPVTAPTPEAAADAPVDTATPAPIDPFAAAPAPSATPTPAGGATKVAATPDPWGGEVPADDVPQAAPTEAPTAPPAEGGKVFRVQVGSYDSQSAAQSMVDELSAAGIHAAVIQDSTGQYHAQIGAYSKRDRALSVADEVNAKGYSVTIRQ
ncbi:MAG TPA: SPOR domain-containing protein [Stenomitos sp.]